MSHVVSSTVNQKTKYKLSSIVYKYALLILILLFTSPTLDDGLS